MVAIAKFLFHLTGDGVKSILEGNVEFAGGAGNLEGGMTLPSNQEGGVVLVDITFPAHREL